MFDKDRDPRYPKQIWFVLLMALLLIILVVAILLGQAPERASQATTASRGTDAAPEEGSAASAALGHKPSPTFTQGVLPQTATPSLAFPLSTREPSVATAAPTASTEALRTETRPTCTGLREEHYWLERPIPATGNIKVDRFYPYASRGDGTYPIHHGVEFVNPLGTEVLATAPSTVVLVGEDDTTVYGARTDFYGLLVILELEARYHDQPVYVLYAHLSETRVQTGQRVETGDTIGLVGMTGYAEGPHLHFEVRYGANDYGHTVNPELWLRPLANHGTLAGLVQTLDGVPVPEVRIGLYRPQSPNRLVRELVSYPVEKVNRDPSWCENLSTGDLPVGEWLVKVYRGGTLWYQTVRIEPGRTTWLPIHVTR